MSKNGLTVLAAATHPDDIEFCFAGTLLLLRNAGCGIHMWNLANGCCGSTRYNREKTARLRLAEAKASAASAGAELHAPLFDDLEIFYDRPSLARVAAVVREVHPQIILTHSLHDYMEDHQNVARLIVTAAFSMGMPNFRTDPEQPSCEGPVRIYHAAPHGLRDGLENLFCPNILIDIASVLDLKQKMLSCHRSQSDWLETSQGMSVLAEEMIAMSREAAGLGGAKGRYEFAEGWRRHSHLGFCPAGFDPLPMLLKDFTSQP